VRFVVDALSRAGAVSLFALLVACSRHADGAGKTSAASTAPHTLRIYRPKQLSSLAVIEKNGALEARLKREGFDIQWIDFAAGPQELEALNAGALDIAYTAESPVIFAQAAGAPIVYLVTTAPSERAVSLLVPVDSPAKSMADLKGKRVACQKASIGHYLLVRALESVGLTPQDVDWVFLAPADASAAFSNKKVDAWFIWEPFVARAVESGLGRVLLDGTGLKDSGSFFTTSRSFANAHPEIVRALLDELQGAEVWSRDHRHEMAELLSPSIQIDVPTLERMHDEYTFGLLPISDEVIVRQQRIADMWFGLGSLPGKVDVAAGVLPRQQYLAMLPPSIGNQGTPR
jgi:sulfonate transport system substrate-binding protein